MTNLLILYPDIQAASTAYENYTDDPTETDFNNEFRPFENCFRGERWQHWHSEDAREEHYGRWDLGSAQTKSCDFVVLSRLDLIANIGDITFNLQSSPDDSVYTDRHTIASLAGANLVGPWENDYVSTFSATSAVRYWRAKFVENTPTAFNLKVGKIYCGTAFDMGVEPSPEVERLTDGRVQYISSGGNIIPGRIKLPTYLVKLTWEAVSDATAANFYSNIARNKHHTPVFLYDTNDYCLEGARLLHCKLVRFNIEHKFTDWNIIEADFLEVHG